MFIGSTVFLTDVNELCVGNGVNTLEKCKHAVDMIMDEIPNARFASSLNSTQYPKGCFLWVKDDSNKDTVNFNDHSTGSSSEHARHVCEYQGNK